MVRWIVILVIVCSSSAIAQDGFQSPEPSAPSETGGKQAKKPRPPEVIISTLRRANAELEAEVAALQSKHAEAEQRYAIYYFGEYLRRKAELELDAFEWQANASEVLLWVVVLMCLSGVVFSGFQLWRASQPNVVDAANAGTENSAPKTDVTLQTGLEISASQLKVTSSVVGLIVLVLSLAYLYLFLKDVYTIETQAPVVPSSGTAVPGN